MERTSNGFRRGGPMPTDDYWRGLDSDGDDLLLQPGWTSNWKAIAILGVYGCLLLVLGVSLAG